MRNEIAAGSMVALASRIGHATLTGLCATVLLSGTVGPSPAAEANALALDGLHALPDSTLDSLRGGFQVGSFELAIGITISTAINGAPVLHTSFNVVGPNQIDNVRMRGPQGPIGPQNPIGPQGAVGPKESTGPQGTVGPNGTPGPVTVALTTGGAKEPVSNSPAGSDSFAIGEVPGGIQVNTSGTQIMHQVDNGVLTRIMNVADGQRISHATAINIAATNFSEVIGGAAIRAQINNLAIESARIGLIAN